MEMTNYIQLVGRMIHEYRNCFVQFVLLSTSQDAKKRGVRQIEKYFQSMQTRAHKSHPPSQEFFSMGFRAILIEVHVCCIFNTLCEFEESIRRDSSLIDHHLHR
jgi:hypothetical protein